MTIIAKNDGSRHYFIFNKELNKMTEETTSPQKTNRPAKGSVSSRKGGMDRRLKNKH